MHTMEFSLKLEGKIQKHTTKWINPEDIMLSEKDKYFIIVLVAKTNSRERKNRIAPRGQGEGGMRSCHLMHAKF